MPPSQSPSPALPPIISPSVVASSTWQESITKTVASTKAHIPVQAVRFINYRRSRGLSGDCSANGMFFDDAITIAHAWMHALAMATSAAVWCLIGVSMADGRSHDLRVIKNKGLSAEAGEEMPALGNYLDVGVPGARRPASSKLSAYVALGREILSQAQDTKSRKLRPVAQKLVLSWTCKVVWIAQMDSRIYALVLVWAEHSQIFLWPDNSVRTLAQVAISAMNSVLDALPELCGHALLPTQLRMGFMHTLFYLYSDAARQVGVDDLIFRGFGFFFFQSGSNVIHFNNGRWSKAEESLLEIPALELMGANLGLKAVFHSDPAFAAEARRQGPGVHSEWVLDVIQVGDNKGVSTHTSNTGKSRGAVRAIYNDRSIFLEQSRVRVHSEHGVRETILAEMADDLSKDDIAAFKRKARSIFGSRVSFKRASNPNAEDRDMSAAITMARAARKRRVQKARQAQDSGVLPRYIGSADAPMLERIGPEDEMVPTWSHSSIEDFGLASPVAAAADPMANPKADPKTDPNADPDSREACYHRAAELFWSRREAGQLRPSESLRMHVLPFMPSEDNPVPMTRLSHPNNRYAAPRDEARASLDVPLSAAPHTSPSSPTATRDWITEAFQKLRAEKEAYATHREAFQKLGAVYAAEILDDPDAWSQMGEWFSAAREEIDRVERSPRARVNYSNLPGGQNGLRWNSEVFKPWYRGLYFDVAADSRLTARAWQDPSDNCELNLPEIWEYCVDAIESGDPCLDIEMAFELCWKGISNRSNLRPDGVILAASYSKLWEWLPTAQAKMQQKETQFDPPRLTQTTSFLSCLPAGFAVAGMATDQLNADGSVKPRLTLDHGFGDRPGQRDHDPNAAPVSINANTPQDDEGRFPKIDYLAMEKVAEAAGVLQSAGVPLAQSAADAESWYEQLPREWRESHYQLLLLESTGMRRDSRLQFGVCAECAVSQRCSFLFTWMRTREIRAQQHRIELSAPSLASPPPD